MKFLQTIFFTIFVTIIFSQTTPTQQPSNLNFTTIKSYRTNFSFSGVPGVSGYLTLLANNPVSATPVNGVFYETGDLLGNAKVLKSDALTIAQITSLRASTNYHMAIFAYNVSGSNIVYNTSNPLTGSFTSSGSNPGNYYNDFYEQSPTMVSDLTDIVFPHIRQEYGLFDENVVEQVLQSDTSVGEKVAYCEYSNEPYFYTGVFAPSPGGWNNTPFSREHIFPRSWMKTNAVEGTNEHDDYHNLALVNNNQVNEPRSNYPMGNVVSNPANIWFESRRGRDENNNIVYEVRDEFKGNVARSIFYMVVAYNGKGGSWAFNDLPSLGPNQDVELLKEWHFQDLPDNLEIAKHEFIYDSQNNRNPFIDFPELVNCIDFRTLTLNGECPIDSLYNSVDNLYDKSKLKVFPNPATNFVIVESDSAQPLSSIYVYNLEGQLVYAVNDIHSSKIELELNHLSTGVYILSSVSKNGTNNHKIVLE